MLYILRIVSLFWEIHLYVINRIHDICRRDRKYIHFFGKTMWHMKISEKDVTCQLHVCLFSPEIKLRPSWYMDEQLRYTLIIPKYHLHKQIAFGFFDIRLLISPYGFFKLFLLVFLNLNKFDLCLKWDSCQITFLYASSSVMTSLLRCPAKNDAQSILSHICFLGFMYYWLFVFIHVYWYANAISISED